MINKKRGFTLVELLVTISIISILTIITVSQFQTAQVKARDVQRKADLSALSKAVQMYYADYGKFPAPDSLKDPNNEAVGTTMTSDQWCGISCEFKDKSGYSYMKVLPKENNRDNPPFCYKVDSATNAKKYALYARLENSSDSECTGHSYTCSDETYCYAIVSPNTTLNADGSFK